MKTYNTITSTLILAVLIALLYFNTQSNQIQRDNNTELRKSNRIGVKILIQNKKIFRVNAEFKNGYMNLNQ